MSKYFHRHSSDPWRHEWTRNDEMRQCHQQGSSSSSPRSSLRCAQVIRSTMKSVIGVLCSLAVLASVAGEWRAERKPSSKDARKWVLCVSSLPAASIWLMGACLGYLLEANG